MAGTMAGGRNGCIDPRRPGRTLTIESADHTFRVFDEDGLLICETGRTAVRAIARFKVRKPESGRRAAGPTAAPET
jgi:hypothetical protein